MIVRDRKLGDVPAHLGLGHNGLFAVSHWETNKVVLSFLLPDSERIFLFLTL